jgi:hypothetical protein
MGGTHERDIEGVAADFSRGRISRRDALKRLAALGMGAAAGSAFIAACDRTPNASSGGAAATPADTIYRNGTVLTMVDDRRQAEAVAVAGGKILAVGSEADVMATKGANTVVVDLAGHTLMPSFIDAHGHFMNALQVVKWANVQGVPAGPISSIADFAPGSAFRFVIPEIDAIAPEEKVKRVVLCTGKVYYDLLQERRDKGIKDVAIVRMEQLYPFPRISLPPVLAQYPNADVVWCQEEPENMGYWSYVIREFGWAKFKGLVARKKSASPATGFLKVHGVEQANLINKAFE